jgi:outer membrane protein OmpA-like peptidoglycan-associated protein
MAIKESAIGKARQLMAEAKETKAPKIAPNAYAEALQALNDADAFIDTDPYNATIISQKAAHAEFMARRAMAVTESSAMFSGMTPEASALYVEKLLARLSGTLNAGDLRDQSIDSQVGALSASVTSIQQTNQELEKSNQVYQSRLTNLEQQLSGVKGYAREQEADKQRLAAEREFNEKFNRVQRYFGPNEAEVYKQGNQLIIRLRGIQFPVGQATLSPENYTLLSKVQQAIRVFGQPMTIVEGHTDSTGSAQTNKELSQKRAEAVKTYFVANRTLPESRIKATGYGPDKPLAPNTTAEGRAMNRRIDVLLTPSPAPQ